MSAILELYINGQAEPFVSLPVEDDLDDGSYNVLADDNMDDEHEFVLAKVVFDTEPAREDYIILQA